MLRLVFFVLVLCPALSLMGCASGDRAELDPIVQLARDTSLYSDRVEWAEVDRAFRARRGQPGDRDALIGALEMLINALGDHHATVRDAETFEVVASYTGPRDQDGPAWDGNFVRTVLHDREAVFSCRMMGSDVGYLRVVGIGPGDVNEQARSIRDGVRTLTDAGATRWILDLRYNGGGNMNPMLAGLAPLLGEGMVAGAVDARGELVRSYDVVGGEAFDSGRLMAVVDRGPGIDGTPPVAVLISRYTVSSGELVAAAMHSRANTVFIGERTGGYTTGTGYQSIGNGLLLLISESAFVDRMMTRFTDGIEPDIDSAFAHTVTVRDDPQIRLAMEWLGQR